MPDRSPVTIPALMLLAACCAAVAVSVPARAQDEEEGNGENEYVREGGWISAAGVFAIQNAAQDFRDRENSGGAQVRAGLRFVAPFDIGIFGEWVNFQGANPVSIGALVKLFPIELFGTSLFGGVVQPYLVGSAGVMFGDNPESSSGTSAGANLRGGGGVDVYLTRNAVLFGEVQYSGAGGDMARLDSTNVALGFTWRF